MILVNPLKTGAKLGKAERGFSFFHGYASTPKSNIRVSQEPEDSFRDLGIRLVRSAK